MSRLIRLYPAGWRARYGAEMTEVLADRPPSTRDRLDLVRGAIDAHLHPTWQAGRRPLVARVLSPDEEWIVRRLGIASIVGGFVLPLVPVIAMSGPVVFDDGGAYRDGTSAIPLMLLACGLLIAGLFGQIVRLPDEARWARRASAVAIPFILLFAAAPWLFPIGGLALLALSAAAIGARRARAWSVVPVLAVVIPALAVVGVTLYAAATFNGDRIVAAAQVYFGLALLIPIWFAIGATLIPDGSAPNRPGLA